MATRSRTLVSGFVLLGAWGLTAPYVGRWFGFVVNTRPIVEVVDHVIPGVVLLALAVPALVAGALPLPAVLAVLLAGLWMAGTHMPLLLQAMNGGVGLGAALFHSLPGVIVFFVATAAAFASSTGPGGSSAG